MAMKKTIFIAAIVSVLLWAHCAQAGVSLVKNGSFENDGVLFDFTETAPQYWCDVSLPTGKFWGYVSDDKDWATQGGYYLALCSYTWVTFYANDMATLSQQVYLTDVNEIIFDVKLDTTYGDPWDPSKRSAVLLIDEDVVWESNSVGSDVRGEYFDQIYTVDPKYKDTNLHKLSLGIRANVEEYLPYIDYRAKWDFVKFDTHCGGFGYLPQDLNHDCYVNMFDLAMLVEQWLAEEPDYKYDLFQDDGAIVNFRDYSILADRWPDYRDWKNFQDPSFLILELLASDLNDDGIVNLRDFAILARDWMAEGNCIRGDINRSKVVDYDDLSKLVEQWLLRSWVYGLD